MNSFKTPFAAAWVFALAGSFAFPTQAQDEPAIDFKTLSVGKLYGKPLSELPKLRYTFRNRHAGRVITVRFRLEPEDSPFRIDPSSAAPFRRCNDYLCMDLSPQHGAEVVIFVSMHFIPTAFRTQAGLNAELAANTRFIYDYDATFRWTSNDPEQPGATVPLKCALEYPVPLDFQKEYADWPTLGIAKTEQSFCNPDRLEKGVTAISWISSTRDPTDLKHVTIVEELSSFDLVPDPDDRRFTYPKPWQGDATHLTRWARVSAWSAEDNQTCLNPARLAFSPSRRFGDDAHGTYGELQIDPKKLVEGKWTMVQHYGFTAPWLNPADSGLHGTGIMGFLAEDIICRSVFRSSGGAWYFTITSELAGEVFRKRLDPIHVRRAEASTQLVWEGGGRLLSADTIEGPWRPIPDASSPYQALLVNTWKFFRLD